MFQSRKELNLPDEQSSSKAIHPRFLKPSKLAKDKIPGPMFVRYFRDFDGELSLSLFHLVGRVLMGCTFTTLKRGWLGVTLQPALW